MRTIFEMEFIDSETDEWVKHSWDLEDNTEKPIWHNEEMSDDILELEFEYGTLDYNAEQDGDVQTVGYYSSEVEPENQPVMIEKVRAILVQQGYVNGEIAVTTGSYEAE